MVKRCTGCSFVTPDMALQSERRYWLLCRNEVVRSMACSLVLKNYFNYTYVMERTRNS